MLLLALDTSTRQASVALCSEERLYGEHTWQAGNNHSVEMLEHVQHLLTVSGITPATLAGLAVALGPGSFNGVRVAVATAKTLAYALGKPLVGISTLEIGAAQQHHWPGLVCSLLEAGRGDLYAGCYLCERQERTPFVTYSPRLLGDYQLLPPQELAGYLQDEIVPLLESAGVAAAMPYLFCGEIGESARQILSAHLGERSLFASPVASTRHAATLAALARQRLEEQRLDDPLGLEPLYLRRPNITTSARKRPLLGQQALSSDRPHHQSSTEREEGALPH